MANVDFPFHFDSRGRTAQTDDADHIRDLIYQVLFTSPGERVMRPTFGSGLLQLVFAPNSDVLAATTQMLVQGALQQWLGELIVVEAVSVEAEDATLRVTVQYVIRRTVSARCRPSSREVARDLLLLHSVAAQCRARQCRLRMASTISKSSIEPRRPGRSSARTGGSFRQRSHAEFERGELSHRRRRAHPEHQGCHRWHRPGAASRCLYRKGRSSWRFLALHAATGNRRVERRRPCEASIRSWPPCSFRSRSNARARSIARRSLSVRPRRSRCPTSIIWPRIMRASDA